MNAHPTFKTLFLSLLAVLLITASAACAKNNDGAADKARNDTADEIIELPVDENAATVSFDEPTPIPDEEAAAVEEYLFSQLGGNHPDEEQFSFSFPVKGTVDISGEKYYIGSWEMRLYNEMGEESSSQVIMDFMLPTDYSCMYEIFGENGTYTVYMRDVLNQN